MTDDNDDGDDGDKFQDRRRSSRWVVLRSSCLRQIGMQMQASKQASKEETKEKRNDFPWRQCGASRNTPSRFRPGYLHFMYG
ncbi:hypothetical protein M0804_000030 [Polistes exclamans]|nr:hypothetical protein M0804_000030 [Polistes exclamans]